MLRQQTKVLAQVVEEHKEFIKRQPLHPNGHTIYVFFPCLPVEVARKMNTILHALAPTVGHFDDADLQHEIEDLMHDIDPQPEEDEALKR
eukprot:2369634-Rhodomonas_salina.1